MSKYVIPNGTSFGSKWACGTCPPHSSLRGKAEPRCSDVEWRSVHGVTCADLRSLLACTRDGQYAGGWNPGWGDWRDNADAHGVTAKNACCACGGGQWRTTQDVNSCECDVGFFDDDLVSGVHCVPVRRLGRTSPPRQTA